MASKPKKPKGVGKKTGAAKRRAGMPARRGGYARLAVAAAGALLVALVLSAGLYFLAEVPERTAARAPLPAASAPIVPEAPAPPEAKPPRSSPRPDVATAPLAPPPLPAWRRYAMPALVAPGQAMIAVVIDDMGVDEGRSRRTARLPAPLTLAYLGYARNLAEQTAAAHAAGHELMVHLPMEPDSGAVDPGPNALVTGLAAEEYARRIEWNLTRFDGFVGVNNHMGSRLTRDPRLMAPVMERLETHGLLFLDSRTSGDSVAASVAEQAGVPALRRDVFLDHDPTPEAVRAALEQTEAVARRQGYAIAIGHPRDATLDALSEWLPGVQKRGFALVPVSAIALRGTAPAHQRAAAIPVRN